LSDNYSQDDKMGYRNSLSQSVLEHTISLQQSLSSVTPRTTVNINRYLTNTIYPKQPKGTSRTFYIRYDILSAIDKVVMCDDQGRRAGEIISLLLYKLMAYDDDWKEIVMAERKQLLGEE